jgi:hypothetical protein
MEGVVTTIVFVGVGLVDGEKTATKQDTATGQRPGRSLGQLVEDLRVEVGDLGKGPLAGVFGVHTSILRERI